MNALRIGWILLVLSALGAPARAEDKAAARQAYLEGSKYYDLNQYSEALEAFKRAYWNYEDPAILFNIAQCPGRSVTRKTRSTLTEVICGSHQMPTIAKMSKRSLPN